MNGKYIDLPNFFSKDESFQLAKFLNQKSLEGLDFVKFTFSKLRFKISEPRDSTYFVDVFYANSENGNLYIENYEKEGWKFIHFNRDFSVFKNTISKASFPSCLDKEEYIGKVNKNAKNNIIKKFLWNTFGLICLVFFSFYIYLIENFTSNLFLFSTFLVVLSWIVLFNKNLINLLYFKKKQTLISIPKIRLSIISKFLSKFLYKSFIIWWIILIVSSTMNLNLSDTPKIIAVETFYPKFKSEALNIDNYYESFFERKESMLVKKNFAYQLADLDDNYFTSYQYFDTSNELIADLLINNIIDKRMYDFKYASYGTYEVFENNDYTIIKINNKFIVIYNINQLKNKVFYDRIYTAIVNNDFKEKLNFNVFVGKPHEIEERFYYTIVGY